MKRETRIRRREEKARISQENAIKEYSNAERIMDVAILQAKLSGKKGEIPVGCVIVKDGNVIARSYNRREGKKDATAHAEILAIKKACAVVGDWRLDGCEIFVTLEPCPMCAGAIMNARLSKVWFGAYERKSGACGSAFNITGSNALNSKTVVTGGVKEKECAALIENFFENKRNKVE